jgi:hypothetical protein
VQGLPYAASDFAGVFYRSKQSGDSSPSGPPPPTKVMRIWIGRSLLILGWLLATHGALDMVDRIAGNSYALGAVAFVVVTAGMTWLAVHLGDVPIWRAGQGDSPEPHEERTTKA